MGPVTDVVDAVAADPWAPVLGQPDAVALLRRAAARPVHAYLFVGPSGSGKRAAARAFATEVLGGDERATRLVLAERHPDLVVVEREGPTLRRAEIERALVAASRAPVEGDRKVILLTDYHLAEPAIAAVLLKPLEEPTASTVFVVLAEEIPPEHVAVASRCVTVRFRPVDPATIAEALIATGVEPERARLAAEHAGGDVGRARLLATDPQVEARRAAWHAVPERLDGRGNRVAVLVDELRELVDAAAAPLAGRHETELAEAEAEAERYGQKATTKDLKERHRRELRNLRRTELEFGLAVLARRYRDELAGHPRAADVAAAIDRLTEAGEGLTFNPSEPLFLQGLFCSLPPIGR